MRLFTLASLVCAAYLSSAAAGQEVAAIKPGDRLTPGMQCFVQNCNFQGDSVVQRRRRCHTCCASDCRRWHLDCLAGCDRMKASIDTDDKHDHEEQGGDFAQVFALPDFDGPWLDDGAADTILDGMGLGDFNGASDSDKRLSLVVASDRINTDGVAMSPTARSALETGIMFVALDRAECPLVRTTAVTVIGDTIALHGDPDRTLRAVLLAIIWDQSSPDEQLVERATEILEGL